MFKILKEKVKDVFRVASVKELPDGTFEITPKKKMVVKTKKAGK